MRLYNTLTRSVAPLVPREEGHVALYVCGPTVQAPPHFGHARASIVPDVLRRYLEWKGLRVLHVRNITDIDDKIIDRASAERRTAAEVAEEYTRVWEHEISRLGVLPPHIAPRATGHILEMQELIQRLLDKGVAYEAGGDVLFSVRSFPRYGQLSGKRLDDLRAGARVEPESHKRDPLDFVLWKAAKPGEPSWPAPWGAGRPGWHIECSAMASKYLGEGFDIHAGGVDLVFPHHENEIAQYEAATGGPFAHHWVHNGLLTLGTEKMSKSVGNIISLAEAIERYGPDPLRFFYLAAHYRSPVDFSEERLAEATAAVDRWSTFLRATAATDGDTAAATQRTDGTPPEEPPPEVEAALTAFREAMDDDLSTPKAHAALFDLVAAGNAHLVAGRKVEAQAVRRAFLELASVLGYSLEAAPAGELVPALVAELLHLRESARERKDFAAADGIRSRLGELGVVVEDGPAGPRWHLGGHERLP